MENELDNNFLDDFDTEDDNTIIMTDDNGDEVEFTIVSMLEHNDTSYILALESEFIDDEEASATVLKEVASQEDDDEVIFEPITDDEEFFNIIELFKQQSDDFDIEAN